jgi:hypothetical protein
MLLYRETKPASISPSVTFWKSEPPLVHFN